MERCGFRVITYPGKKVEFSDRRCHRDGWNEIDPAKVELAVERIHRTAPPRMYRAVVLHGNWFCDRHVSWVWARADWELQDRERKRERTGGR